jgi:hypothetical protein
MRLMRGYDDAANFERRHCALAQTLSKRRRRRRSERNLIVLLGVIQDGAILGYDQVE